jgi:hypothetical protein
MIPESELVHHWDINELGEWLLTEIPPYEAWKHVERCCERIACRKLTVPTVPVRLLLHVPARLFRKCTSVRLTVLAGRGWEDRKLVGRTSDFLPADQQCEEAFKYILERRQLNKKLAIWSEW